MATPQIRPTFRRTMLEVVWFKRDLRVHDHAPLTEAARRGPVLPLFIYEEDVITADDFSSRHLGFLNECLSELSEELTKLCTPLVTKRGKVTEVLGEIHRTHGPIRLWSHEETGNAITYARDLAVGGWCRENGVEWTEIPQHGVIRRLGNRDGWSARWKQRMDQPVIATPEAIRPGPATDSLGILTAKDFGLDETPDPHRQTGGRRPALELFDTFLTERGLDYTKAMSSPVTAFEACSRLSPYLSLGTLSIREAYQRGISQRKKFYEWKDAGGELDPRWLSAMKSFLGRLRWHCHFIQKLEDEPSIEFENFARVYDGMREPHWNEDRYQAWATGHTGYPMVDACMRALIATGWINFRMRAMLMSFASYHLWLHWRRTGLHLARLFTDYEPGIHWSQCQMQSGTTGINTIRVYSPTKQVVDQDPEGIFIRKWVPELKDVPKKFLAEPHTMPEMEQMMCGCVIGRDYPAPVVDHKTAYAEAQRRMRDLRKGNRARAEASAIQQKHGSRKRGTRTWR